MKKCDQINCFRYSAGYYDGCQLVADRRAYCLNNNHALFKITYYGAEDCKVKTPTVGGTIAIPVEKHVSDPVSHPSHYTSHPSGVECITIAKHENFCIGNALKYLWRAGRKDPNKTVEDLKKAAQYIQYEIDRITEEQSK